jgi:hypothetical protein
VLRDNIGVWWPKSESNRHFPCGKTDFLPTSAFAASQCAVCGLDYAFISVRWLPSSLYTFPSPGLVRRWHQHYLEAFTEFDNIHAADRSTGAQSNKSVASAYFAIGPLPIKFRISGASRVWVRLPSSPPRSTTRLICGESEGTQRSSRPVRSSRPHRDQCCTATVNRDFSFLRRFMPG